MNTRKYEKASSGSSFNSTTSFWKKSSNAIPGRPNPSKIGHSSSRFSDFEHSVSDAWEIQEDSIKEETISRELTQTTTTSSTFNSLPCPLPPSTSSSSTSTPLSSSLSPSDQLKKKSVKIEKLLESQSIEIDELRRLAWSGISEEVRSKTWKILCGYLPGNLARCHDVVQRKREEYQRYVQQYFQTREEDFQQDTYRQIHIDIPRMSPVVGLFQQKCVQEIFERILYIWAIRHPASGYVQGINDLVTPFFLVFLRDYYKDDADFFSSDVDVERTLNVEQRSIIEADSFWCLTKVLDGIQDNYTFAQPGIQLKVKQLEELIQRIDYSLHQHLVSHDVAYLQFAFRWMNNLLMREIPIKATIRLWDTYLAEENNGFSHFHLYVCAAFLMNWKHEIIKKTDFHTILMFLQNLPTAKWGDEEINLIVAEAFKLSYLFADAPNHLLSNSNSK